MKSRQAKKKTWDIISSFCIETDDQMVNPLRGNPPPPPPPTQKKKKWSQHTQTIRRLQPTYSLSVFEHFWRVGA